MHYFRLHFVHQSIASAYTLQPAKQLASVVGWRHNNVLGVTNLPTLWINRFVTRMLTRVAKLFYYTAHTCCKSATRDAGRSIWETGAIMLTDQSYRPTFASFDAVDWCCSRALQYFLHVSQIDKPIASAYLRHVCCRVHGSDALTDASRRPMRLARAAWACHVRALARTFQTIMHAHKQAPTLICELEAVWFTLLFDYWVFRRLPLTKVLYST